MALSGSLALFALAGPAWKQLEQPVFRDQSALILILDLSRSMDATDVKPNRLARARHKLTDILKNRKEGLTALVVYAAEAFVVSPLTQDTETIMSQTAALKTGLMPRQGSRPDLALEKAAKLLQQAGLPRGHILIITDGLESVAIKNLEDLVDGLQKQGHTISILGIGTPEGAPIPLSEGGFLKDRQGTIVIPRRNDAGLKKIADRGNGHYQPLSVDDRDITQLLEALAPGRLKNQTEKTQLKTDRWREEGPWFLLMLLPFAALALRRGIFVIILLFAFSLPTAAQALDWEGLWSRQDQRAANKFQEGNMEEAATLFENPAWKASSHYRAGQYQKSIDALEGVDTPDAYYNKGNALAQMGNLPEALQAYDQALKRDPKHEDAGYNREQIQNLMDQQNQKKQQEGEGSQDKKGDPQEQSGQDSPQDSQGTPDESASNEGEQNKPGETQASEEEKNEAGADENQKEQQGDTTDQKPSDEQQADSAIAQAEKSDYDESSQAIEQWLRRIPDDPGGLLRRKFLYQSGRQATGREEREW